MLGIQWSLLCPLGLALVLACDGGTGDLDAGPPPHDASTPDASIDAPAPPIDAPPSFDAAPPPVCDDVLDAGADDWTNPGFPQPTTITQAYQNVGGEWVLVGDADFSCRLTPSTEAPTSIPITAIGEVTDFQTGNLVANPAVSVFATGDLLAPPDDTTTGDANGNYSLTLPVGALRPVFFIEADDSMPTYQLGNGLLPAQATQQIDLPVVSQLTANALPAFIGVNRTLGLGLVLFEIRDCGGNRVEGAIATISTTSGCVNHLDGEATYYFSAGSTSLPVRWSQQAVSNQDGFFMVIELPPTPVAFVQVWGYVTGQNPLSDRPTLLAELPIRILGDTFVTGPLAPLRTP